MLESIVWGRYQLELVSLKLQTQKKPNTNNLKCQLENEMVVFLKYIILHI